MYLSKFKAMCECSGLDDVIVPGVTLMTGVDYVAATARTAANVVWSGMAWLTISSLILTMMISKLLLGVPFGKISTHLNLLAAKYLQPMNATINQSQVNRDEYWLALYGDLHFISNRGGILNLDSHHSKVMIFRHLFTKLINQRMNTTINSCSLL